MTSLLDLPHAELRRRLATGSPVFLPVNPVEYHGPHLSLHNDAIISRGLAADLHARLQPNGSSPALPMLYLADLELGVDPCPGPGTRATPFGQVRDAVVEACERIADLGATRVVLITFHGAPLHSLALQAGVDALRARGVRAISPMNVLLAELAEADAVSAGLAPAFAHIEDPRERAAMMREIGMDFHAGFFETSLALHYAPESVAPGYHALPPCESIMPEPRALAASRIARRLGLRELAGELDTIARGLGWYALRPFPGYTGRPHRANAAAGAVFARKIVELFGDAAARVFDGGAGPAPVMPWLLGATAGGRFGAVHVPMDAVLRVELPDL